MNVVCATCGEAAGGTGSMAGTVHRWGPTDHPFEPVRCTCLPPAPGVHLAECAKATTRGTSCPWCESANPPVPNSSDPDPKHRRLNPWRCPDCRECGGWEDWQEEEAEER